MALAEERQNIGTLNHAQCYGPAAANGNINGADFGQIVSAAAHLLPKRR